MNSAANELALGWKQGRDREVLRGSSTVERVHIDPGNLALCPLHAGGKGAAIGIDVVELRNGALPGIQHEEVF